MNPTEHTIKAQDFRQWLLRQPDDRMWNYGDVYHCVVCSFLKETGVAKQPVVGGTNYDLRPMAMSSNPIPGWLITALQVRYTNPGFNTITARNLKTALNL